MFLGVSDSSYFRSKILGNLVKNDYLAISGEGRTKYYKTNKKMLGSDKKRVGEQLCFGPSFYRMQSFNYDFKEKRA